MPFRLSQPIAAAVVAALLLVGAAGCSDDSSGDKTSAAATDANGDDGTVSGDGDASRPFGVDADGLATAMKSGTGADRVEVDGNTFRLYFDEGSTEDVMAMVKCSAMDSVKGDDDSVVMVFPDGELECDEETSR